MITNTELEYKGNQYPSKIVSIKREVDSVYFHTDGTVILKLTVLRDSLLRFRYTTKGYFSNDFSYAIDKSQLHGYNFLEITETELYYQVKTSKVLCRVFKKDLRVFLYDLDENVILKTSWVSIGKRVMNMVETLSRSSKSSKEGECFYGLGDKATQMNLKGKRVENFATDQYAFGKDQEPLYKVSTVLCWFAKQKSVRYFL